MPVADLAIVVIGPAKLRSIRDGCPVEPARQELAEAALGGVDDEFVLVSDRPIAADVAWREVLASLTGGAARLAVLVCPSWWPARRTAVVAKAAQSVATDVVVLPRSLALASAAGGGRLVVEVAQRLIALVRPEAGSDGRPVRVLSRDDSAPTGASPPSQDLSEGIFEVIATASPGWPPVVLDEADGITGPADLPVKLAGRLSAIPVIRFDDDRLLRVLAGQCRRLGGTALEEAPIVRRRRTKILSVATGASVAAALGATAVLLGIPAAPQPSTVLLSEGRVAVRVPADWTAYRVTSGSGSARVQVTAPSNPVAALHITQAAVPFGETLSETAQTLRSALGEQPAGVFVDFNPTDRVGERSVVTYREVRARHHVRWAVLLDGGIRIGVGCQSPHDGDHLVRHPCRQAVSSVRKTTGTVRVAS